MAATLPLFTWDPSLIARGPCTVNDIRWLRIEAQRSASKSPARHRTSGTQKSPHTRNFDTRGFCAAVEKAALAGCPMMGMHLGCGASRIHEDGGIFGPSPASPVLSMRRDICVS